MIRDLHERRTSVTFVSGCGTLLVCRNEFGQSCFTSRRNAIMVGRFTRRGRRIERVWRSVSRTISTTTTCSGKEPPSDDDNPSPQYVVHSDADDDDEAFMTRYVPPSSFTEKFLTKSQLPSKTASVPTFTRNYHAGLPGPDPPFMEDCNLCKSSGFIPCSKCGAEGFIRNPRSKNAFYCPVCVGHRKIRCPSCGGRCYMC